MKFIDFNHTKNVGETYWQHLSWTLYATMIFVIMIPIAVIHGLFPFLLANVPDRIMVRFYNKFRSRRVATGQAERYPEKR